jgi:hypothetical protein
LPASRAQAAKWGKLTGEAGTVVATAAVSATVASTANTAGMSVTAAKKLTVAADGTVEQAAAAVSGSVQVPAHLAFVLRATKTLTEHLPTLWKLGEFHLQHAIPEFPCVWLSRMNIFFLHTPRTHRCQCCRLDNLKQMDLRMSDEDADKLELVALKMTRMGMKSVDFFVKQCRAVFFKRSGGIERPALSTLTQCETAIRFDSTFQ